MLIGGSYSNMMIISDVLSESTVGYHTLQDVACSDHRAIAVAFNFDQLPMTHTIQRPKNKHINWKFEDVELKRQFYERLDNMLGVAPGGLLRVNRGLDVNTLTDLLTFISNAIIKSGKQIFGMRKPSKFNVPGWNERARELNARYREAVSHWNIACRPRSGPLADLKCRTRADFRHEMKFLRENEDQFRSQSILSKLQRSECNDFWKKLMHSIQRRNPCP